MVQIITSETDDFLLKVGKQPLESFAIGELVYDTASWRTRTEQGRVFKVARFEPGHRVVCVRQDDPLDGPAIIRCTATKTKVNPVWRVWLCKVS